MAHHVNHHDVQDRMLTRNTIIANRSGSLIDRDPATLSITEQETLVRERMAAKIKATPKPKAAATRFTGRK